MHACRTAQSHLLERAGAGVTCGGKTVSGGEWAGWGGSPSSTEPPGRYTSGCVCNGFSGDIN